MNIEIIVLKLLYYFRYLDFFSTNNTYSLTDKSEWSLDDGYKQTTENNLFLIVNPIRTTGVSYYHRLRVVVHSMEDDFLNCGDIGRASENTLVCNHNNYVGTV